ncbi:hypothetical protein MTR67_046426, partial [Solanum verrucosum]
AKFFCFLKIIGIGFKAKAESHGCLLYINPGCRHEVELTGPSAVHMFCFKSSIYVAPELTRRRYNNLLLF